MFIKQKSSHSEFVVFSWKKQLYKRLCLSVHWSVGPFVRNALTKTAKTGRVQVNSIKFTTFCNYWPGRWQPCFYHWAIRICKWSWKSYWAGLQKAEHGVRRRQSWNGTFALIYLNHFFRQGLFCSIWVYWGWPIMVTP